MRADLSSGARSGCPGAALFYDPAGSASSAAAYIALPAGRSAAGPAAGWNLLLAFVKSVLFGRLGQPPLCQPGGIIADSGEAAAALVGRAVQLADRLRVKHLEACATAPNWTILSDRPVDLQGPHVLALLTSADAAAEPIQGRASQLGFAKEATALFPSTGAARTCSTSSTVVFSHNMRDLGTPVFGKRLFQTIFGELAYQSELGCRQMGRLRRAWSSTAAAAPRSPCRQLAERA